MQQFISSFFIFIRQCGFYVTLDNGQRTMLREGGPVSRQALLGRVGPWSVKRGSRITGGWAL